MSADPELVHVTVDDGIATITLDSQPNRNALSQALLAGLHGALDVAEHADARAIVLTHAGPAFCAGADLKERAAAQAPGTAAPTKPTAPAGSGGSDPFVHALQRLMDTPCPTIAAVKGAVRAGGIGLMAACDLVVVDEGTTFALTEVRIGVAAAIISVPILARVAPSHIAAAMLTGEPFDAAAARSMGLVTHVSADVDATVAALCAGIAQGSPRAVAATKRLLHTVPSLTRDDAFAAMATLSSQMFSGDDAREGMAAFADKRRPAWAPADTASDTTAGWGPRTGTSTGGPT